MTWEWRCSSVHPSFLTRNLSPEMALHFCYFYFYWNLAIHRLVWVSSLSIIVLLIEQHITIYSTLCSRTQEPLRDSLQKHALQQNTKPCKGFVTVARFVAEHKNHVRDSLLHGCVLCFAVEHKNHVRYSNANFANSLFFSHYFYACNLHLSFWNHVHPPWLQNTFRHY